MHLVKLSPYTKLFYEQWKLDPQRSDYNIVIDQEMYGEIDKERLNQALNRFTNDYLVMHSKVAIINRVPYWQEKYNATVEFNYYEGDLDIVIYEQSIYKPFDLENDNPVRYILFKISEQHYRFLVVMHHIVIDASKGDFLIDEISRYYNNVDHKCNIDLDAQSKAINDLAENFDKVFKDDSKYRTYWSTYLQRATINELDFLRLNEKDTGKIPQGNTDKINSINFKFEKLIYDKTQTIKNLYEISPFFLGLLALAIVYHRFTYQLRPYFSYPISIREGTEFFYGAHVNSNIIVFDFENNNTLGDLINETVRHIKNIKSGKTFYYPIGKIISSVGSNLPINFTYSQSNIDYKKFAFVGIHTVNNIPVGIDLPTELTIFQEIKDSSINFYVRYRENNIDQDLLNYFLKMYKKIFLDTVNALVVNNLAKNIKDYQILDHEQYVKTIVKPFCNMKKYECNKTIHEIFEEQVKARPEHTAIIYESSEITYGSLNKQANQLANYLWEKYSIESNELIVIYLDRSHYTILAILAILKLGATYIPIDMGYPPNRIEYILQDTKAKFIVTSHIGYVNLQEHKLSTNLNAFIIDDEKNKKSIDNMSDDNLLRKISPNNNAYVIYTSGTTGLPKGVLQSHENVVRLFSATKSIYNFNEKDKWILFHSYAFDFSIWEIWGALFYGGKLIIPTLEVIRDPGKFYNLCYEENITILNQIPSAFYQFIEYAVKNYESKKLTTIRYIIFGGEKLNLKNLKSWFILYGYNNPKLINMYGITETTVHVTHKLITESAFLKNTSNIGKPLDDQYIYILDSNQRPVPIGVTGEIYVGGAGLSPGYVNSASLTNERFIDNPFQISKKGLNIKLYKSGDLARWLPNGELEYLGRNDSQVKIRGYRIELGEIENVLNQWQGVKQSLVLHFENTAEIFLCAYYISEKKLDEEAILPYLTKHLPDYMLPQIFIQLKYFPLTINGKLDKSKLPKIKSMLSKYYVEPENEEQSLICKSYSKVLGINKIGIDDDFFQMGGDSLKAITLVLELQSKFKISVADIFDMKTPRKIAENVSFVKDYLWQQLGKIKSAYKKKLNCPIFNKFSQNKRKNYCATIGNRSNFFQRKAIKKILLTGATGYLGANLLNKLLSLTEYTIFLLVRASSIEEAWRRVSQRYSLYFNTSLEAFGSRVKVVVGDIEKDNLNMSNGNYQMLVSEIDSIIHAAALTKHYGDSDKFYSVNVQGTINLLNLTSKTQLKDFHYISTNSVFYNADEDCLNSSAVFTEDDLVDKLSQQVNIYIKTKYEGEKAVINYWKEGVLGSIYRVGNLAFNSHDYCIQENRDDNAFIHRLRCLLSLKIAPCEIEPQEISPVDLTAEAIVKLFDKEETDNGIYHVFNPNLFNLAEFFANDDSLPVKLLPIDEFIDALTGYLEEPKYRKLVERFLLHQGWMDEEYSLPYTLQILQGRTDTVLKQLGFEWPVIHAWMFKVFLYKAKLLFATKKTTVDSPRLSRTMLKQAIGFDRYSYVTDD